MNLLVTNTRNAQAYAIIRSHSGQGCGDHGRDSRLTARLSHAANSRLADKRHYVPSPVEDRKVGNIKRENTEREEAYIRAIERWT